MMFTEGNGLDLATFINTACRGGGSGGSGNGDGNGWGDGGNGFLWLLLFLMMGGRGWGGFGGMGGGFGGMGGGSGDGSSVNGAATCCCVEKAVAEARAAGLSDQVVVDAVRGNGTAIAQIASALNCGFGDVQTAICGIDKSILQLSSQIGMSGQQIINAVQAGNCDMSRQLADCCCEMKQMVTTMNYENRIANMDQTNQLIGTMNAGFAGVQNRLDAGFQGLHDYLTAEKIDGLRQKVTTLENAANNANQTAAINAYVNAAVTPVANRVTELMARVPPNPIPAYPAPQYATGYAFGIIPTSNCNLTYGWNNNNCGCGCSNNA